MVRSRRLPTSHSPPTQNRETPSLPLAPLLTSTHPTSTPLDGLPDEIPGRDGREWGVGQAGRQASRHPFAYLSRCTSTT